MKRLVLSTLIATLLVACNTVAPAPATEVVVEIPTQTVTTQPTVAATIAPTNTTVPTPLPPTATPTEAVVETTVSGAPPEQLTYEIIATYPHDPNAFTQGLQIIDGQLYEGTGLRGQSTLRKVDLNTGAVEQSIPLEDQYFGEGITVLGDQIYQLTWQSQVALVYDRATFTQTNSFAYDTEGWGLTFDGEHLVMSDGTPIIYFRDPVTFEIVRTITVTDDDQQIAMLNELEYIDGAIYANIWQTDWIVRIDPATGDVTAWIDMSGLLDAVEITQPVNVLNGIAYDADADKIYVTGKLWPALFEVQFVPQP